MADPLARITSILESAKEMTIEAAVSASTRLSETPLSKRPQEISALLNSRNDREVLNGMKCVMALVSRGEDVMAYFADVVKNVTSSSSRVKNLVLVYIEKFAEMEPDTALLAINSIQKSLADKKPASRAASIRTLGGIRIPEIGSLLVLSIKRTVGDRSAEVRAATALAIGSAYGIDGIDQKQLMVHLSTLLSDDSADVVGSALKVFMRLKSQMVRVSAKKAWAPIHANFRRYTTLLSALDPWAQTLMVDLLVEYCKRFIPRPKRQKGSQDMGQKLLEDLSLDLDAGSKNSDAVSKSPDFFEFGDSDVGDFGNGNVELEMDSDLKLFVEALRPSAFSCYRPVLLSAVRAIMAVASPQHLVEYGYPRALVQIAWDRSNAPEQFIALQLIMTISARAPTVFQGLQKKFFIHAGDDASIAACKFQVLSALFSDENARDIIKELQYNAYNPNRDIARHAVRAIGVCCQKSEAWTDKLLTWCTHEITEPSASYIISDLLTVIRYLLQHKMEGEGDDAKTVRTIYKLSKVLLDPQVHMDEAAKASIIWLIGEFTDIAKNVVGPDVVREFLKDYANEPEKVRYEVLLLAAKSYSYEAQRDTERQKEDEGQKEQRGEAETRAREMLDHVTQLGRYDPCIYTRDKVRMVEQLFREPSNAPVAALLMQVPKGRPELRTQWAPRAAALCRYMEPQPWAARQSQLPPKSIRNAKPRSQSHVSSIDSSAAFANRPNGPVTKPLSTSPHIRAPTNQLQSLDDFFGNTESESESESDSGSESESESEEEIDGSESESGSASEDGDGVSGSESE